MTQRHDHIIVGKDGHASLKGLKLIWRCLLLVPTGKRYGWPVSTAGREHAVARDYRFGESITLQLQRDEAIVLFWYLTREVWGDSPSLQATFVHPAEAHSLKALLQELIPPLMDTGAHRSWTPARRRPAASRMPRGSIC